MCEWWVVDTDEDSKISMVKQLVYRGTKLVDSCFSGRMLLGFLAKDLCIIQVSSRALGISVRML